jgi:hypothetical protein
MSVYYLVALECGINPMTLDRSAEISTAVNEWTSAGRRPPIRAADCGFYTPEAPEETLFGPESYSPGVVAVVRLNNRKGENVGEKMLHADGSAEWLYSTRPTRARRVTAKMRGELGQLLGEVVGLGIPAVSDRAAQLRGKL